MICPSDLYRVPLAVYRLWCVRWLVYGAPRPVTTSACAESLRAASDSISRVRSHRVRMRMFVALSSVCANVNDEMFSSLDEDGGGR